MLEMSSNRGTRIGGRFYERDSLPEGFIDITDDIKVYEKGKTVTCPECSQGIGTFKDTRIIDCAGCDMMLVDMDYDKRMEQKPRGQQSITRWTE